MAYDLIVIGAGAAGEAAATLGAELGANVAVIERDLIGGECAFWACMPSKVLLDSAHRRATDGAYSWQRASARRDWMITREGTQYPSDANHARWLEGLGAKVIRGRARITAPGRVGVEFNGSRRQELEARNLIVAIGSTPSIPKVEGLVEAGFWTHREATSTRELPASVVLLGAGPVGVELAQIYVRFGVAVVLVQSADRILSNDHPRSSEIIRQQLVEEGVEIRAGVKATRVNRGGLGRRVELSDGSIVEGEVLVVATGRRPADLRELGVASAGVALDREGRPTLDHQMKAGEGLYVAGDAAGGLQFTHLADYQGRVAAGAALGLPARVDLSSIPRTTLTYPETAAVGLSLQEAQAAGVDAFEVTQDFAATSRGQTIEPIRRSADAILEGTRGHLTAVIDRERGVLAGAFAACPAAGELIHEAVLAMRLSAPVAVLADTIHAFPTGARAFGNLMAEAAKQLQ
ncbi:NAD(P)/FAD-dependent oxidoreductase [soil metagenome]